MSRPSATACRICGAPRRPNKVGLALCEDHLREYWREQKAKRRRQLAAAPAPAAPPAPPAIVTLPAGKIRKRPSTPAPAPTPVSAPAARPVIGVCGDRVTMSVDMLKQLLAAHAPAPAARRGVRLAVVSASLETVRLYEIVSVERGKRLTDAGYARELAELREAGYLVCVEG
jgi:hypothetical protein